MVPGDNLWWTADEVGYSFRGNGQTIGSLRQYLMFTSYESGYSRGDGGTVVYEIRPDAGGVPGNTVLATTGNLIGNRLQLTEAQANAKYPGAHYLPYNETSTTQKYAFPRIPLDANYATSDGEKLWMTVRPTHSDTANHNISVNAIRNRHQWLTPVIDPRFDASFDTRFKSLQNGVWVDESASANFGYMPVFDIIDTNGNGIAGQRFYQNPADITESDKSPNVGGSNRARQRIVVPSGTLSLIAVCGGLNFGSAPMTVTISQNGSTLYTGSLTGFPQLDQPSDAVIAMHDQVRWSQLTGLSVSVSAGSIYLEVSAPSGTDYDITGSQNGSGRYFTGIVGVPGEISTNGGSSWTPLIVSELSACVRVD